MLPFISRFWRGAAATLRDQPLRQAHALAAFGAALIIGVSVFYAIQLNIRLSAAVDTARRTTQNLAEVLAEHTARTFEALNRTLQEAESIRRDYEAGRYPSDEAVRTALKQLKETSPALIALGWTDADGNVRHHTYEGDPPRPSVAGMIHFTAQIDAPPGTFHVAPPFRSAATGRLIGAISRRVSGADGRFAGTITAAVDQGYFDGVYRELDLGAHGSVVLLHTSGMVLTRVPAAPEAIGKQFPDLHRFASDPRTPPSGALEATSVVDGRQRIIGYKILANLPLALVVSYDRAEVQAPVYAQVRMFAPFVALLLASIALGIAFLVWQARVVASKTHVLEETLNAMDQGLIMVDRHDRLSLYNRRALELLGLPSGLMATHPSADTALSWQLQHGEFAAAPNEVKALLRPSLVNGEIYSYQRLRPNGAALEVRTRPIPGGGVVRTYTDITQQKEAERALHEAKSRAEEATRAKGEFLANMSHELRTPLTAILGISELLLSAAHPPDERARLLKTQRAAAQGLLALINDLLDLSKIEAGELALERITVVLRDEVDTCLALLADQAKSKGVRLSCTIADSVPGTILGDPLRLRQVVLNLLSNAVKFTERGCVHVAVEADGMHLRVAVTDTGIGIEAQQLPTLFQRFAQGDNSTSRRFGGTGLGLAISRTLVEMMGGEISVESVPGHGSTFRFSVPLSGAPDAAGQVSSDAGATDVPRYRILLAEDNEVSREVIAAMLRLRGHELVAVADGVRATEEALRGGFDLVLMDVHMPGTDGYAATRAIRASPLPVAQIPIVALTANATPQEAERCRIAGMDGHAAKPVDWPRLCDAMARAVAAAGWRRSPPTAGSDPAAAPEREVLNREKLDQLVSALGAGKAANLLRMFQADAEAKLAADRVPSEALAVAAHDLGGSAGLLGFDELTDACRALEAAIAAGGPSPQAVNRYFAACGRAIAACAEALRADTGEGRAERRAAGG